MQALSGFAGGAGNALFVLAAFVFVLSVVVFVHEMGHFLVARWCGVSVKAFSLGFGPEICSFTDRKGTRWRLAWLPLGGYVKFMDDENGASVPSREILEKMTPEERAGSFHAKPLWQKAAVVAAGPIANFLLAIVMLTFLSTVIGQRTIEARVDALVPASPAAKAGLKPGDLIVSVGGERIDGLNELERYLSINAGDVLTYSVQRDGKSLDFQFASDIREVPDGMGGTFRRGFIGLTSAPRVDSVVPGRAAAKAGFQAGDLITAVDGQNVVSFDDVVKVISASPDRLLAVDVLRGTTSVRLQVTPDATKQDTKAGPVTRGTIGITRGAPTELRKKTLLAGIAHGVSETRFIITSTLQYLRNVIVGREDGKQLGGPIRIAEVSGQVAKLGFEPLLHLVAMISVSVGFVNLFPIPLLDGGHLLFYAIEGIRRRPMSERSQEFGFKVGLAIVLALFVFVMWNDRLIVLKWVTGSS